MINIIANSDFANLDIILEDLPGGARKPSRQIRKVGEAVDAYLIIRRSRPPTRNTTILLFSSLMNRVDAHFWSAAEAQVSCHFSTLEPSSP